MSVLTSAIMNIQPDWAKLEHVLSTLPPLSSPTISPTSPSRGHSKLTANDISKEISAIGTATIFLERALFRLGRSCLSATVDTDWRTFLTDKLQRKKVIEWVENLAKWLGSELVIFIPDSQFRSSAYDELVETGLSADEILKKMRSEVGPPATTPEEIFQIQEDGCWTGDGYYLLSFS